MKIKNIVSLLIILTMMMSTIMVSANTPPIHFNGQPVDVSAVIVDDRTLLPARDIVDLIGGEIDWNPDLRQVTIVQGDIHILLTIDSDVAFVGEEESILDVPAQLINDRTKVPLRFVAESLGVDVDFVYGVVVIDQMVWLSATGFRWHATDGCGNIDPYRARIVTLQYARVADGIEGACSMCNPPE